MTKSLLIGLLLLTSAARASAQAAGGPYTWVPVTVPYVEPPNAVKAPAINGRSMVACKGTDRYGRLWAGSLAVSSNVIECHGSSSGTIEIAITNLYVLTTTTGAQTWLLGSGSPSAGNIGALPTNVVNAGNTTVNNYAQNLCALGGYVGSTRNDGCMLPSQFSSSASYRATVLTW